MIHKAENEVCVTVFFDEGLTDADIKKLGDTISQRNEVSRIHYTSADEAWENYKAEYFKDTQNLQRVSRMIILLLILHHMRYILMKLQVRLHL